MKNDNMSDVIVNINDQLHNTSVPMSIETINKHLINILSYRGKVEKQKSKDSIADILDGNDIYNLEQKLFDEKRKILQYRLVDKIERIKAKTSTKRTRFFDYDQIAIENGMPLEIIKKETKRVFVCATQDIIGEVKDDYYKLPRLSSAEKKRSNREGM